MPTLDIGVRDLPEAFRSGELRLVLQTKEGYVEGVRFSVPYELREDRQGVLRPFGNAVQKQPDGRRFVYLVWLNGAAMVGRIKVQFDAIPLELLSQDNKVTVSATGPKGRPAGGSVKVLLS